jgi:tetratricopeptide (TPR) repeat protein
MICLPGLAAAILLAAQGANWANTLRTEPKLSVTGLAPAVLVPDLCVYRYPVSTRSAECQQYCDQAFGYFYSYVWIEAARSFETALTHDPDCAVAWLGLHNALEKWGKSATPKPDPLYAVGGTLMRAGLPERFSKSPRDYALSRAKDLLPKASHREQLLITAKLHEKGMMPGTGPDDRRKKAQQTLDELLSLYPDDEEGWFARAQLGDGTHGKAPYYHALLKLNPLHPGANHEFVHYYENIRRPALGWPYAEAYMKSSPGLPHAFHMQAHLAMRVGKWTHTTDWSWKAIELQKEYHRVQGVKHSDDHQFFHHMETLTRSLVHEGRFAEAKRIKEEAIAKYNYHFRPEWFRMAVAEQDWAEAENIIAHYRKGNKPEAAYFAAVLALERGESERARAEIDVLRQAQQKKRGDRRQELRLWEVQGRLECQTGNGEAGIKLLRRTIDKTKDDYQHHAWGGGAYYMEVWGIAALEAGNVAEAEEAFQEALAHDAGSVRGALGMWAICERLGRADEAARYLKVARRCWAKAEPYLFNRLQAEFAKKAATLSRSNVVAGE